MIQYSSTKPVMAAWQQSLADSITDLPTLLATLELRTEGRPATLAAEQSFALRVPREFVARMSKGNWDDPLLRQVLPQAQEMTPWPGYTCDPLHESAVNPLAGILHKYYGRVLLTVAGGCAINCRYCFRRHFPYNDNMPGRRGWHDLLNYVARDPSISEVIYSGGDPLLAKDNDLLGLTVGLATIPHVQRLRIHTRLPIVIPSRVTHEFVACLTQTRLRAVLVLHCNHANEIDQEVGRAMQRLREQGVTLLNQAVLLKGVNDNAGALIRLSEKLFAVGVLPYYLHLLDKVQGAQGFEVEESKALELMDEIKARLPGYLVPKLAKEKPGWKFKQVLAG